jgi:hypothetical protein
MAKGEKAERVKLRRLSINRGKWLTGEASYKWDATYREMEDAPHEEYWPKEEPLESSLLDARTGLMCCLGFACLKLGLSKQRITNQGMPAGAVAVNSPLAKQVVEAGLAEFGEKGDRSLYDTATASSLSAVNDDVDLNRRDRERQVREYFADIGWKVTFTGKYPDYRRMAKRFGKKR